METLILSRLTCLGHPARIAVFRLLARRYPDEVPAGEIARALGFKANTLSVYLGALMRSGLVSQSRAGTSLLYRTDWAGVRGVLEYLTEDCCHGRPELCGQIPASGASRTARRNVLFVCTGNSGRSIFAEAILRRRAPERFNAYSAGTHPSAQLSANSVQLLRAKGHDLAPLVPKHIKIFHAEDAPRMDFVISVCDQAANEGWPAVRGQTITAHWGVADPADASSDKLASCGRAYETLEARIGAFLDLPLETLDPVTLQHRLDDISNLEFPQ